MANNRYFIFLTYANVHAIQGVRDIQGRDLFFYGIL